MDRDEAAAPLAEEAAPAIRTADSGIAAVVADDLAAVVQVDRRGPGLAWQVDPGEPAAPVTEEPIPAARVLEGRVVQIAARDLAQVVHAERRVDRGERGTRSS
jgi:hypothetical protein